MSDDECKVGRLAVSMSDNIWQKRIAGVASPDLGLL